MRSFALALLAACIAGCQREPVVREELQLNQPLRIAGAPFRTGGFPANADCMKGSYRHAYEITSGPHAGDQWLCCIPLNELLRDSFSCADGALMLRPYVGNADDLKVQYCVLYDATSTEVRFTPACIPAPLVAPEPTR